mgnify:CR=1 FL=1
MPLVTAPGKEHQTLVIPAQAGPGAAMAQPRSGRVQCLSIQYLEKSLDARLRGQDGSSVAIAGARRAVDWAFDESRIQRCGLRSAASVGGSPFSAGGVNGIWSGLTAPPEMMKAMAWSIVQSVGVTFSTGTISR